MLVVVTDAEAMPAFERALVSAGDHGFTVLPALSGRGRSGLHAGDRVHPGASSVLFLVLRDADKETALRLIRAARDEQNVEERTRIFSVPAVELS